jgi:hypothetical protein
VIIDGEEHTVDEGIHTDILLEYINEWLDERPYHGMIAVEITHCTYPHFQNQIHFFYNYKNRPEFVEGTGNTSFNMPLDEYKKRVRNKSIDNILE